MIVSGINDAFYFCSNGFVDGLIPFDTPLLDFLQVFYRSTKVHCILPRTRVNERNRSVTEIVRVFQFRFRTIRNHRDCAARDRFERTATHEVDISSRRNHESCILVRVSQLNTRRVSFEECRVNPSFLERANRVGSIRFHPPPTNDQSYLRSFISLMELQSGKPPACTPGR